MGLSQILESAFCYLQQSLFYYYFNMYIRSDRLLKGGENVKFIHTGDIHWGMSPDSDKPWSRERSRDIRDTFTAIIAKAKELRVDCLFIAGDLFHRQPLLRDLKEVNYLFSTIPQTQVIIIAGNHDRIRKNSAVLSFSWASNVTFLESEDVSSVYFEDINTEVTGFSYYTAEIPEPRLDALEAPEDGKIHILLGHGGDANHVPIDRAALASSGFSYIALGHIHRPEILLDPEIGQVTTLDFIPMAKLRYIPLIVRVTPDTTNTELYLKIAHEIEQRGNDNIFRFKVQGMRDPDISFDLDALKLRFRIADIIDETEPQYDFSALFAEHPSDMIGFYIQALKKPDMSPVEKKALFYGIHALLLTTDERS